MDFSTLETDSFIKDLKCSMCSNYLSYFPVYLTKNKLNICGRCELPEDPENSEEVVPHIRNEVYEIVAKEVTFPCRYAKEGCTAKLQSKDVPEHEKACPLRLVKCPVSLLDMCDKVVSLPEVGDHCKQAHLDVVLKEQKFEINLLESKSLNTVVITKDGCFGFKAAFESQTKTLSCTLMCSYLTQRMETFKLCLESDSTSVVKSFSKHRRTSFRSNINLNVFEGPGSTTTIKCELLRPKEDKVVSNDDIGNAILKILQCHSCGKHLKPPVQIFVRNKKTLCISCRGTNYLYMPHSDIFDTVAEKLLYPCKYQSLGCCQSFYPSQLNFHEILCPYRTISCPLSCQWKGLANEIVSHISTEHAEKIANSPEFFVQVCDGFGGLNVTRSYVLKFGGYFFRLCFSCQKDVCRWSVQMIGFWDDFCYEIEIVDCQQRRKLVTTKSCSPLVDEKSSFQNGGDFCYFMLGQFEDMLSKYMLKFRVRIFK